MTKLLADWTVEKFNADVRISPFLHNNFAGLPSTTIVTAEFDPLNDAGHKYAGILMKSGVKCNYLEIKNTIHGFMQLYFLAEAKHSMQYIVECIRSNW